MKSKVARDPKESCSSFRKSHEAQFLMASNSAIKGPRSPTCDKNHRIQFIQKPSREHKGNEKGKKFKECECTYQPFNKGQNSSLQGPKNARPKNDGEKKPKYRKSGLGQPQSQGRQEEEQSWGQLKTPRGHPPRQIQISPISSSAGTRKLKLKLENTLEALRRKASQPEARKVHASSLSSAITPSF